MNRDKDVRQDLKNVLRGALDNAASSFFIDKSLAIIDESAHNKESFMAAAVKISKRTALFIDQDLAEKVYENLVKVIGKSDSPAGTRRRYRRVTFAEKVRVQHSGKYYDLLSENLSEGGMFIRTHEPFPSGSELEIALPLEESLIHLKAVVRRVLFGESSKVSPGMGVEFKGIGGEYTEMLRRYVREAPIQAIL